MLSLAAFSLRWPRWIVVNTSLKHLPSGPLRQSFPTLVLKSWTVQLFVVVSAALLFRGRQYKGSLMIEHRIWIDPRGQSVSRPFPASGGPLRSLACDPASSIFKASSNLPSLSYTPDSSVSLCYAQGLLWSDWAHRIIQGHLKVNWLTTLNPSAP